MLSPECSLALLSNAVSHEYAQLQKQLAAAHEDQAVSAALLQRLSAGVAGAPATEGGPQEGGARASGTDTRRRSALDPLRPSQVNRQLTTCMHGCGYT